jgi:hypothetical protein
VLVDPIAQSASAAFAFHPAAPTVARSPDGRYWARTGEKALSAFNPQSGQVETSVSLPLRPYNHIITRDGTVYVTHHTLTDRGFTVSIVDLQAERYRGRIVDIHGLRTDLTADDRFVYLACVGVGRPDSIYLYEIDTRTDRCRRILGRPKTDHAWRCTVDSGLVYLVRVGLAGRSVPPEIEVIDPTTGASLRTITDLSGVSELCGGLTFFRDYALLPCRTGEGTAAVCQLDRGLTRVVRLLALPAPIDGMVGVAGWTLVYTTGTPTKQICFYDLHELRPGRMISVDDIMATD